MKNLKKFVSLGLAAAMVLSMAACGNKDKATPSTPAGHNSEITIGTWWVQHYDSNDTALTDSPDYEVNMDKEGDTEAQKIEKAINREVAESKFAKVKEIEEKYDVKFYWQNLTYSGVQESINTSILAGSPDCDIYLVDAGMGIPAQTNGLALDLKTVLPEDHDLFTDQIVATYLDLGDGKACLLRRQGGMDNSCCLAYNAQLLADNNLEDPRALFERGEWTWDKFIEYAQALTQDTDGDGQIDQWGYMGYLPDAFEKLMMSNGASIATSTTEGISSPAVAEVLQLISDMYNVYNITYVYDVDADANDIRTMYRQGNIGFFPIDVWIQQTNGSDYDWDGALGYTLPFDVVYCQWPIGPSGNADTNATVNNVGGELYMIPVGVQEPEVVFGVLYDMWNWYDLDTSRRDDKALNNWWYAATGKTDETRQQNYDIQTWTLSHSEVDLWNSIGVSYDLNSVMKGEMTPAQFQETYKQEVQDALDATFGN